MTIDKNENSMQVNNAGIVGAIVDWAASGFGKVSFVSMIFFPNVSLDVPNVNYFLEARE
jgi:surface antigen